MNGENLKEAKMQEWYPEQSPQFDQPGEFEAVIYASDRPPSSGVGGKSYTAFAIRRKGETSYKFVVLSSDGESEEWRAYIAASVGVVESLPPESKVHIHSHHKTVVTTFNDRLPEWKRNGWKKKSGSIAAREIFQRYDHVCEARTLDATFKHTPKNDPQFRQIFNQLALMVDKLAKPFPELP